MSNDVVQVSNHVLKASEKALDKLFNAPIKATIAFKIKKNIQLIAPILVAFEEARIKLLNVYCTKNEDGTPAIVDNNYSFTQESMVEFQKDFTELANVLNDLALSRIPIGALESTDISASELTLVDYLIAE